MRPSFVISAKSAWLTVTASGAGVEDHRVRRAFDIHADDDARSRNADQCAVDLAGLSALERKAKPRFPWLQSSRGVELPSVEDDVSGIVRTWT